MFGCIYLHPLKVNVQFFFFKVTEEYLHHKQNKMKWKLNYRNVRQHLNHKIKLTLGKKKITAMDILHKFKFSYSESTSSEHIYCIILLLQVCWGNGHYIYISTMNGQICKKIISLGNQIYDLCAQCARPHGL